MKTSEIITILYLLIAVNTTYFLGNALYKHGEQFLRSIFKDRMEIIIPVNKILLIGFYLVNVGFVLLHVTTGIDATDLKTSIEVLSIKVSIVYLVIAAMHFINITVFMLIEHNTTKQTSKQL